MQKRRQRFSRHRRRRDGACAGRKLNSRDGRDRRSLQPVPGRHRRLLYRRANPTRHNRMGDGRQRRLRQSVGGFSDDSFGRQRDSGCRNRLRGLEARSGAHAQNEKRRAVGARAAVFPVKRRIVTQVGRGSAQRVHGGRGCSGSIGREESSDALEPCVACEAASLQTLNTRVHDRHAIGPHDLRARLGSGSNRYLDYDEMSAYCQRE